MIVVSDHGFSTIKKNLNIEDLLKKQKFKAGRKLEDALPGDVVIAGLGGSVALYVIDHDESTIRKLVELLQGSDFAGVIFTRTEIEGTFPLDVVHIDTTNPAPDIVLSMRWTPDSSASLLDAP